MNKGALGELLSKNVSIGITGFSRAGKTVFIGSVAQALLRADAWEGRRGQGPLAGYGPFQRGSFRIAYIRDDIHGNEPQFPLRRVRDALCGVDPRWPAPTEGVSRLVMDLEFQKTAAKKLSKWKPTVLESLGHGHCRVELIDYPGEWLVDLPMLKTDFPTWSESLLERAKRGRREELSREYFSILEAVSPPKTFDEELVLKLVDAWTAYLETAAGEGLVFNQPGRLLRPDRFAHSPVLRLVPLPSNWADSEFYAGMTRRYKDYGKSVIKPFYKKHFARIDRQIVLVDLIQALWRGEEAFNEMLDALGDTLQSFSYGRGGLLDRLIGKPTSHLLFAATKADHVTRGDRNNLRALLKDMVLLANQNNIILKGPAKIDYMALASVRATGDMETVSAPKREVLFGHRKGAAGPEQLDPGGLPLDLPPNWREIHFEFMRFEPVQNKRALKEGFDSINIGKALDFLIGDLP